MKQDVFSIQLDLLHLPEGPSTQYLRTLVSKTMPFMVLGTRVLKYWVLGPSRFSWDPRMQIILTLGPIIYEHYLTFLGQFGSPGFYTPLTWALSMGPYSGTLAYRL